MTTITKIRTTIVVLCLCGIVASGDEVSNVERAVRCYGADAWPTNSVVPGAVGTWEPILPEAVVNGREVSTNRLSSSDYETTQFSCFPNGSILSGGFDFRITRWNDFGGAKTGLLSRLGGMESPILVPSGTNGLEVVGDICFAKENDTLPSVALFVRNNISVFCYTTIGHDMLTNLLQSIDGQILDNLVLTEE